MFNKIKKIFGVTDDLVITEEYLHILEEFELGANLFITGKAGSGKSRLIEYLRTNTSKKVAVLAPTGLAALNIRGQTVHSFFKLPRRVMTKEAMAHVRIDESLIRQVDAVIIDEASMVRADMLDAIDILLRRVGRDKTRPFGGMQVILVGDLFQLPPVVTNEDRPILEELYSSAYFFGAGVYRGAEFEMRTLTSMFRQTDPEFVNLLNAVRQGEVRFEELAPINARVGGASTQGIFLSTTNSVANQINLSELTALPSKEKIYSAGFEGEFRVEDRVLPVEPELILKKGARVMFVKNGGSWVNGTLGVVTKLRDDGVSVQTDDGEEVAVEAEEWDDIVYKLDPETKRVEEKKIGSMRQLPLRLAWAVTIHKSQGMTFDRVHIDFSRSPFAHGQTYVALSRCRTIGGLSLSRPIYPNDIIVDPVVVEFLNKK